MPLQIFPVAGPTTYSDDWGANRSGGRSHQGNDLFAAEGTPVVAVDDGTVSYGVDPLGGPYFGLRCADGRYYGAHLSAYVEADQTGTTTPPLPRAVKAGDIIGRVGHTGNAAATPPHLHFQMWIGGQITDPYPYLKAAQRGVPIPPQPLQPAPGPVRLAPLLWGAGAALAAGTAAWWALRKRATGS